MKRKVLIEELEDDYPNAKFYTFCFSDEDDSEFQKFLNKFDDDTNETFREDIDVIMQYLNRIGEDGAIDRFFRPEGGSLKALPIYAKLLRLYCFKINGNAVILGNGGVKEVRAYQDDLILNKCANDLKEVGRKLLNRLNYESRKAQIYNGKLFGELEIEIDTE